MGAEVADERETALGPAIPGFRHWISIVVHGKADECAAQRVAAAIVNLHYGLISSRRPVADGTWQISCFCQRRTHAE